MNDTTTTGQPKITEEFVWRRLEEPLKMFNYELPWQMWLVMLGVVLALALFYVTWMYIKDSKSVGMGWASLLGFLRTSVYIILAIVFLLPARQSYVQTKNESKVVVLFDVSDSTHTSDVIPSGRPKEQLPTRMDQVVSFLKKNAEKKENFLAGLGKNNAVTVYRFGTRLDEDYWHLATDGRTFTRQEKEKPERDDNGAIKLPEVGVLGQDLWGAWLAPKNMLPDSVLMSDYDKMRLKTVADYNARALKDNLLRGTNIGDSLINLLNREVNNRLQGVVVFTDGRNTEGSPDAFQKLAQMAKANRVPLFVVAVGEDRQKVKIEIVDSLAPPQIQPEDKFRVKSEVTGEGLPSEKLDVTLDITHVRLVKTKVKNKEGKLVDQEKEEDLPLYLIEPENPENPKSAREKIMLGTKLTIKPATEVILDKGTPPRAEVEWQLDAAALAAAAKIDLTDAKYKGKKWEIGETLDDSEIKFQIRVPVDKREGIVNKQFHESNKLAMKVIKKPLRVLLLAAAANRDYQFIRTMLVREMDKKRLDLSIHLQLPPGQDKYRPGVVQDIPANKLLTYFPDTFRKKKDLYDLTSYDVIIAFDPDWRQIGPEQTKNLKDWVEKGGGLVLVGGHINTVELVKFREDDTERFKPILDMLPVVLDDRRDSIERKTEEPFPLDFEGASPELEFLRLDEELDASKFKEDWQAFFYGTGKERTDKPQRGFFSFYPVQRAKTGSIVVARFMDPNARLKDNTLQPYIVLSPESLPRVIWIGSAETWRLREYREEYHERFWTKLVRYAGAKSKGGAIRPIRLEAPSVISAGRYMEIAAKIDGPDGQPLNRNVKPQITLKMPAGVPESEIRQPIVMSPRPGASDGWFTGRFQVRSAGDYELTVTVPRQPGQDSDQTETARFTVKEANPELDNTRPDFDRMFRMASEADEVFLRMSEGDRNELKRRLVRPKLESAPSAGKEGENPDQLEIREDKMRLYFDLKNAELIPTCMVNDEQVQVSRGRHRDLWDDGLTIYEYPESEDEKTPARQPIKISYVLLLVVGLLSIEWLTRKLLRLA